MLRVVTLSLLASLSLAGAGLAQTATDGPQETPPADFIEPQYVDSRGCVFMRAGVEGDIRWVGRVTPEGAPLCGYLPSIAELEPAPEPVETAEAEPAEAAPAPAAAPAVKARRSARAAQARRAPVTPICPEDAPYRGSFVTEAGIETGICTSNPERGVLGPTAATGALVPDRLAGPMTLRGGALEPVGETVLREAYVQIGAYARPANAEGARARLAALGLPVAGAKARMAGKPVQIVFAGPFELAGEARAALAAARKAGFRDAFIR